MTERETIERVRDLLAENRTADAQAVILSYLDQPSDLDEKVCQALHDYLSKSELHNQRTSQYQRDLGRYAKKSLSPYTIRCNLLPNQTLSVSQQELQFRLLVIIEQFIDIADQIDRLGESKLSEYSTMWSDAIETAMNIEINHVSEVLI